MFQDAVRWSYMGKLVKVNNYYFQYSGKRKHLKQRFGGSKIEEYFEENKYSQENSLAETDSVYGVS